MFNFGNPPFCTPFFFFFRNLCVSKNRKTPLDQAGASGDQFGDLHGLVLEKSTRGFAGKKTAWVAIFFLANLALLEPRFFGVKMSVQILII